MGVEYSGRLCVGFEFSQAELDRVFADKVPERWHMEDRYDVKTGKKLRPVKVVIEDERIEYRIPGCPDYDSTRDSEHFYENVLATYLDCSVDIASNSWTGETGDIIIGPRLKLREEGEFDNFTLYGAVLLRDVRSAKFDLELDRVRRALIDLGLAPGEVVVKIVVCVF